MNKINGIHNTNSILQAGINEYNVKAISMYDKDGDIVIKLGFNL